MSFAEQAKGAHAPRGSERGRHHFIPFANERNKACARCGRPKNDPRHTEHPEIRRAALIAHLEAAVKSVRESDEAMAAIHVGAAQRVLEEP